jgi:hypothetical protein
VPADLYSVETIGCLAPQAGSWLNALAMGGFVLAARALRGAARDRG